MSETTFRVTFIVLWIVYILIRAPFTTTYKQQEKVKKSHSTLEKCLLLLLAIGLLLIPLVWMFTPFLDMFSMGLPVWARWMGVVISILSLFYFHWIHKALGANWSPTLEIRKGHQLIQSGPYKRIRHPMYTQGWLWTIAQFLIVSNTLAGLSGIVAWAILYFIRVPREERMMLDTFGEEYLQYMKQTGSVFPRFRRT